MTPCRAINCPNLVMRKHKGYCDKHKDLRAWVQTKTASERGYGKEWRKVRVVALERDKYLCQACLKDGVYTQATDVDHILNKASGGTDDLQNLQSLCRACHKTKTAGEGGAKVQRITP